MPRGKLYTCASTHTHSSTAFLFIYFFFFFLSTSAVCVGSANTHTHTSCRYNRRAFNWIFKQDLCARSQKLRIYFYSLPPPTGAAASRHTRPLDRHRNAYISFARASRLVGRVLRTIGRHRSKGILHYCVYTAQPNT